MYVPRGSPLEEDGPGMIRPWQPWLAGNAGEALNFFEGHRAKVGVFEIFRSADFLLGWAQVPGEPDLEVAAGKLYGQMLQVAAGRSLYHIWNWVPAINACSTEGEEHYRLFCKGRAQGFEAVCGRGFEGRLPSASAVGHGGESLMICFVAGRHEVRHFENPEQVPAWRYPPRYGPRSPSFARASLVDTPSGPFLWVSGTASIKGSDSVFPGNLEGQVETTISNLGLILERTGGSLCRPSVDERRYFRVYLRDRRNLRAAQRLLQDSVFRPGDSVVWVEAEICRSELEIEIELTVYPPGVALPEVAR